MAAEGAHVSSVAGWGLFALKGQCVCQQVHTRLNGVWGVGVCGVGGYKGLMGAVKENRKDRSVWVAGRSNKCSVQLRLCLRPL